MLSNFYIQPSLDIRIEEEWKAIKGEDFNKEGIQRV